MIYSINIILYNNITTFTIPYRSSDGRNWELVTPGCRAPQKNLVARGFLGEGKAGIKAFACDPTAVITGCYGAEECDAELKTCKYTILLVLYVVLGGLCVLYILW